MMGTLIVGRRSFVFSPSDVGSRMSTWQVGQMNSPSKTNWQRGQLRSVDVTVNTVSTVERSIAETGDRRSLLGSGSVKKFHVMC